ncbi:hypothetical protein PG995_007354 [Apiospora arundinis]
MVQRITYHQPPPSIDNMADMPIDDDVAEATPSETEDLVNHTRHGMPPQRGYSRVTDEAGSTALEHSIVHKYSYTRHNQVSHY